MTALTDASDRYTKRGYHGFFEDWDGGYVDADRWTGVSADSSSASTKFLVDLTAAGGVFKMVQDATDNDELYLATTVRQYLIAANKPMMCEGRFQYTEGNTDDCNVMFGFKSAAAAANDLLDDGGGPLASATMALIYKVDGGTVWRCRSQIGAAVGQTDTVSQHTAGGSAYQTLRIEVNPISSTVAEVIYSIDDGTNGMRQMLDANNVPIKHQLVYTNAVACCVQFGSKAGGATAETLLCDYVTAWQKR